MKDSEHLLFSRLASGISDLALAVNRLAATQEKDKVSIDKGAVYFSTAHFEDQPDAQTEQLREIAKSRQQE